MRDAVFDEAAADADLHHEGGALLALLGGRRGAGTLCDGCGGGWRHHFRELFLCPSGHGGEGPRGRRNIHE